MSAKPLTIVCFGDSITEATTQMPDENKRWPKLLHDQLMATFSETDFQVINAGVGGNSAREAMARFDQDVLAYDPDWIVLEFGGNNDRPEPDLRVEPAEFTELLNEFRQRLPSKTQVVVMTFPPVIDEQHQYCGKKYYQQFGGLDASVERYRSITRDFAAANSFPLVDFYGELKRRMVLEDQNRYTLPDGIHLTVEGNRLLAIMISTLLQRLIKPHDSGGQSDAGR